MNQRDKGFMQGFATALAIMNKIYDQPSMTKNTIQEAGFDISDFEDPEAEVSEYDLKAIQKAWGK